MEPSKVAHHVVNPSVQKRADLGVLKDGKE